MDFSSAACMDPSVLIYESTAKRWFAIFFNLNANYLLLLFFVVRWDIFIPSVVCKSSQDEVENIS